MEYSKRVDTPATNDENESEYLIMDHRKTEQETHSHTTSLRRESLHPSFERSWRVEPHDYNWSQEPEGTPERSIWIPDIPPVSVTIGSISSSLPSSISHPTLAQGTTSPDTRVPTVETPTSVTSLVTATSCVSLTASHSPVSRFLPRLLRNSFSKIRGSIPTKSKSVDKLKNSSDEVEPELDTSTTDIISPIDEEMVTDSMRKGLPIIPFSYPNFVMVNKNIEDTKTFIRENSLKDLKHAFRSVKKDLNEENCTEEKPTRRMTLSLSELEFSLQKNLRSKSEGSPGAKSNYISQHPNYSYSYTNQSSYVEMSPQEENILPRAEFADDPYMVMDREKREKHSFEDTIFHLEQSNHSKEDKTVQGNYFLSETYLSKTMNMFRRNEDKSEDDFDPLSPCERRQYKKGNKHKGDYVFLDLGKNKDYVSMGKSGTWKSLSFYKKK